MPSHCAAAAGASKAAAGQAGKSINYAYDPAVLAQLQDFYNHDNSVLTGRVGV